MLNLTPEEQNKLDRISKEEFYAASNKHLPNKWISFAYKYFSSSPPAGGFRLRRSMELILMVLPTFGFLGIIFDLNETIIKIIGMTYSALLILIFVYLSTISISNSRRIKKIAEELKLSKNEYNYLANKFYTD